MVQQEHIKSSCIRIQRIRRNRVSNVPTRTRPSEGRDDDETLAESRNRGEGKLANFSIVDPVYSRHRKTNTRRHENEVILFRHSVVSRSSKCFAETNTTIEVDDPCIVPVQRVDDKHIMDFVLSLKKFTRAELRQINYCRLFLDAHTISDITTACGRDLSRELG